MSPICVPPLSFSFLPPYWVNYFEFLNYYCYMLYVVTTIAMILLASHCLDEFIVQEEEPIICFELSNRKRFRENKFKYLIH